ncbi:MAG: hypothetical protein KatS3mg091_525 [Patescibacteria group bacterium]|nr:MAG: hypothetical protein KatS3mg091_525 [Patescibacteria group bacterium]
MAQIFSIAVSNSFVNILADKNPLFALVFTKALSFILAIIGLASFEI